MKRLSSLLGIVAAALLGTAVHAEDIVIGHLADITGGTAEVGKPYAEGVKAYAEYLCGFIARSFSLPLDGICLEEPEFWMRGGWSPAFRREWEAFYGEPWQPPDASLDACYRAAALKKELYRRCLETVCGYVRREKPDWECIVATHSLINYANWGIASPESALATIPACDTVIAQVWSDTILTPCSYDGRRASRP